jgi:RNA polymerase sigma-70 factor (ECF subfamily)
MPPPATALDPRVSGQDAPRHARFRAVFQREFNYVWASLRRLGVHDRDAEDVAQDVFVHVYRRLDDYDPTRPLRPWLFAFAFRCASDWRRLARHRVEGHDDLDRRPGQALPADAVVERAQDHALVLRGLEQVDLERRGVFILFELDQVPMKDVADSLGIPLFTAYSRLRVAREEFTAAVRRIRAQEPHGRGQRPLAPQGGKS